VIPDRVTTDGHDAYPRAIRTELGSRVWSRISTYLNNRLEQDHRGIKGRCRRCSASRALHQQDDIAAATTNSGTPSLLTSHMSTRSRCYKALALHAPDSRRARYSESCMNGRSGRLSMLLRAGSKADRAGCDRLAELDEAWERKHPKGWGGLKDGHAGAAAGPGGE
jgi:hypothetical protein